MARTRWTQLLGIGTAVLITAGCTAESRQRWNDFWGISNPKPKRTVRAQTPKEEPTEPEKPTGSELEATAENAQPEGSDAAEDRGDPEAIRSYASRTVPREDPTYRPNNHASKIRRHEESDPHQPDGRPDADMRGPGFGPEESAGSPENSSTVAPEGTTESPVRTSSLGNREASAGAEGERSGRPLRGVGDVEPDREAPDDQGMAAGNQPADAENRPTETETGEEIPRASANPGSISIDDMEQDERAVSAGDGEAPVLEKVEVSAAKEEDGPEDQATAEEKPATPSKVPMPAAPVDTFEIRLKAQEERVAKDPNNVEELFNLRLMYLFSGDEEKAVSPIEGVDANIEKIVQAQMRSLIAARTSAGRDPSAWASRQLESIEALRRMVRARADLDVPEVALCTAIEGFGLYEPIEPAEFKAGAQNRVVVYVEVDNFVSKLTPSGLHRTLLSVRYDLFDREGQELLSKKDENIEDLARQQRRDFFLTLGPMAIPTSLAPGEYILKVEVEDVLAGKLNSRTVKFKIVP